ncbi:crotonase/enoyl-CoA hydratase family protein [Acidimicrobiia bacterium EGI L10123]|uniref:crotonase/enoyl-CoA hydratase family protein n=1 Tax=Salinilacustrithrix flava TaxID=2957203 RepID=UPI003D7C26D1|nr:crotonase/enoyl-CoA hydratase family protein [Acidimicrobiia bacterium EGI L10123]
MQVNETEDQSGAVTVIVDGPVAIVEVSRTERRNAVDQGTATSLHGAFSRFDQDEDLSVAVLTGDGGTFCAGADLKAIGRGNGNRVSSDMAKPGPLGCTRMMLSKPVIAAVEGFAVAGGLELALWCDLRVAARDASFGVFCRRWGVPLVDGGTVRLPRLIGQSRALDMILTGRPISGEEAFSWGLANRLCEPGSALKEAVALAQELAALPQMCLRSDRLSTYEQWSLSNDDALKNEVERGLLPIRAGETRGGAQRFANGAGRHGTSAIDAAP